MPHRRSQATVTQFLRDALAVDELGVPELEARARATGLLGERQSITHIKVFKRAISWHKVASGWIWSSQSVAVAIATTERRLHQNRGARTSRPHSNRLGPGGRLSPP